MNERYQQEKTHNSLLPPAWPTLEELVGREEELRIGLQLLAAPDVRLLTLTGVAGVGKTRLALALMERARHLFADGALAISLAALKQPALLVSALLRGLRLREERERSSWETLLAFLRTKQALLLLDNFEQLVAAAPLLANLLEDCPDVKVLVTSREILRVRGEHLFQVYPLPLPDLVRSSSEELLAANAAVRLFTRRLRAIRPEIVLSEEELRVMGEICVRLDGLPLAIELAVARYHLFSPRALLVRLESRLALLTHGPRDLPPRQQTLRAALDWSYELLSDGEQRLFRGLAAFASGWTPAAAQAISGDMADGLDLLTSLLEKSLLQRAGSDADEPRLHMLETLREYGLERLRACGEYEEIRDLHANYYLRLAEQAELELEGLHGSRWLLCLGQELDNLRAALQWLSERGEDVSVLRLAVVLRAFWISTGTRYALLHRLI